jgi:hypothetical protein
MLINFYLKQTHQLNRMCWRVREIKQNMLWEVDKHAAKTVVFGPLRTILLEIIPLGQGDKVILTGYV